jgi:hypothetical protein
VDVHPVFRRVFALATVSVELVHCVSTHSPSFEAWIANKAFGPQFKKGRRHWRAAAGPGKLIVYEQYFQPRLTGGFQKSLRG